MSHLGPCREVDSTRRRELIDGENGPRGLVERLGGFRRGFTLPCALAALYGLLRRFYDRFDCTGAAGGSAGAMAAEFRSGRSQVGFLLPG